MLENGIWTGPIMDQHMHLDKNNLFLRAVDDFFIAGGTAINLVHKPDFNNLPKSLNDYQVAYNETLEMANEIREKYEISVNVILGPHPVAWEKQIIPLGIDRATELHIQAVDLALEHIKEKNAVCLGEVGRPHYPVNDKVWRFANELLLQIMQKAAKNKVSVQLHVEDNGYKTYSDISGMCKISKLPKKKAIRHFAPPNISSEFTQGISSTVNVGKGCIKEIIETLPESESFWGMETDYLDDLNRPGAVLGPKTVPKRTQELSQTLWKSDYTDNKIIELMLNIHSKWPSELYP